MAAIILVKEVWDTKQLIKDKMTGRVDIIWRIFEKIAKKLKWKSQNPRKHNFWMVLEKFAKNDFFCSFILNFLALFFKMRFRSFCLLWIFVYSNFFLSNFTWMMFSRLSWWLDLNFKKKIVNKYRCLINGGDILLFNLWKKEK